jgi:hypothetical protein
MFGMAERFMSDIVNDMERIQFPQRMPLGIYRILVSVYN